MIKIKVVAVSDLHGRLPDIPECDLLLIAGDICPTSNHDLVFQRSWLETNFQTWMKDLPAKRIIGIAGNHDFIAEQDWKFMHNLEPWIYLHDNGIAHGRELIYGTPWSPQFYDWAFMTDEETLASIYRRIPQNTTILLSHSPPRGYGDITKRDGSLAGSFALMDRINELPNLKLVVFGHIHEGFGQWRHDDRVTLANVSLLNEYYEWVHDPVRFNVRAGQIDAWTTATEV